uniref:Uncharacterized protein n=1 Tax=Rhizophora mucronata TaxID=61149 RepID=A0A2P2M3X2_RHIMU
MNREKINPIEYVVVI